MRPMLQVAPLLKRWARLCSAQGCCRVSLPELRAMHDYVGPELGFYFAWASFYTRYLWPVGILGAAVYVALVSMASSP